MFIIMFLASFSPLPLYAIRLRVQNWVPPQYNWPPRVPSVKQQTKNFSTHLPLLLMIWKAWLYIYYLFGLKDRGACVIVGYGFENIMTKDEVVGCGIEEISLRWREPFHFRLASPTKIHTHKRFPRKKSKKSNNENERLWYLQKVRLGIVETYLRYGTRYPVRTPHTKQDWERD